MNGYKTASSMLPVQMRAAAEKVPPGIQDQAAEFRLRRGYPPTILLPEGERELPGSSPVGAQELSFVLENAARSSPYAVQSCLAQGYIIASGGVRVGLCGQLRRRENEPDILGALTSLALRIPRQVKGCSLPFVHKEFISTLILSPPGWGKTTLLRDMVRMLSDGGLRLGLCDERGEVAGFSEGEPGFDVGCHTDTITGVPKAAGTMMLLRAMNPQIIAMDEITAPEDIAACAAAANCGVRLLATAHGGSLTDLQSRELYRKLTAKNIFRRIILIGWENGKRKYQEEWL